MSYIVFYVLFSFIFNFFHPLLSLFYFSAIDYRIRQLFTANSKRLIPYRTMLRNGRAFACDPKGRAGLNLGQSASR